MPLVSSGEYPFHLCKVIFPRVLQIYVSFFGKIAPLASSVRLKTRFGDGPGAPADSYAVENPNVGFEDLSHTSQRTESRLQPSRRCGIIALPESQHGNWWLL